MGTHLSFRAWPGPGAWGLGADTVTLPVGDEGEGATPSTDVLWLVLRPRGDRAGLTPVTGTRFVA